MSRQVKRMRKGFEWPLKQTWWGYLLDRIKCVPCGGTGENFDGDFCRTCEGGGEVWPKVQIPGYDVDALPSWFSVIEEEYGWQMWEETSERSPISPVCDSPEELARWLKENNDA